jgi:hypothetical protein
VAAAVSITPFIVTISNPATLVSRPRAATPACVGNLPVGMYPVLKLLINKHQFLLGNCREYDS